MSSTPPLTGLFVQSLVESKWLWHFRYPSVGRLQCYDVTLAPECQRKLYCLFGQSTKKIKDPYYWLFVGVSSHKEPVMSIVIPCNDVITQNDIVRYACMDEFGYKSAGGVKKTVVIVSYLWWSAAEIHSTNDLWAHNWNIVKFLWFRFSCWNQDAILAHVQTKFWPDPIAIFPAKSNIFFHKLLLKL